MIKTEQLWYLIELNRTNSFHKCAQNLHLSQPAVSLAIQNLEKELGVVLFTRTPAGVYPTPMGAQVVKKAKKILENIEEIYLKADEYQMENRKAVQKVSFYAAESILAVILPSVLLRIQRQYPEAKVSSREWTEDSLEAIEREVGGIGLKYFWKDHANELAEAHPGVCFDPVCTLHYYLAMHEKAPFVMKSAIKLDLSEPKREAFPVVLFGRSTNTTRDVLDMLIDDHNADLIFQAPTEKLFDTYIRQGLGAGLIVQYGTNKLLPNNPARDQFVFVPLETKRESELYLITNKNIKRDLYQRMVRYLQFGVEFL